MRTPAGPECHHYYEDYNRGRDIQLCRLARLNPNSLPWEPADCAKCPVPAILRANGSPHLELTLTIGKGFLGLGRGIEVQAFCEKHQIEIKEPQVGCPVCNSERPDIATLFEEGQL